MLEKLKALLGVSDTSQDAVLQIHLDAVKQAVLNYCNRDDLPVQLEPVIISKTVFLSQRSKTDVNVASRKTGNTQINFVTDREDILDDVKDQLDRFKIRKKVRFR